MSSLLKKKKKKVVKQELIKEVKSEEELANDNLYANIEMEVWTSIFKRNKKFKVNTNSKERVYGTPDTVIRHNIPSNMDEMKDIYRKSSKVITVKKTKDNKEDFERYKDILKRSKFIAVEDYEDSFEFRLK